MDKLTERPPTMEGRTMDYMYVHAKNRPACEKRGPRRAQEILHTPREILRSQTKNVHHVVTLQLPREWPIGVLPQRYVPQRYVPQRYVLQRYWGNNALSKFATSDWSTTSTVTTFTFIALLRSEDRLFDKIATCLLRRPDLFRLYQFLIRDFCHSIRSSKQSRSVNKSGRRSPASVPHARRSSGMSGSPWKHGQARNTG